MEWIDRKDEKEMCDNCLGNKYPIGEYCEGCRFTEYRRKKNNR